MDTKELMETMFGVGAPYPGMEVEWECFAGKDALESGTYRGHITSMFWCGHCNTPTITAESESGAKFYIHFSGSQHRWVCGKDAPE